MNSAFVGYLAINELRPKEMCIILFSKVQLVVYYQCCVLIG